MKIDWRQPEYAMLETGDGWHRMNKESDCFFYGAGSAMRAQLRIEESEGGALDVYLEASGMPVSTVQLFWRAEFLPGARFLGDAFERTYGDVSWQGLRAERCMPWYCLIDEDGVQSAVGTAVGAGSFVSFFAESSGITMMCDVSAGPQGVSLKGRSLKIASIIYACNEERPSFPFACDFMKRLCKKPKLCDHKIYGFVNWYYAYGVSSAETVVEESRIISELAGGIENRPYMVIDDGWQLVASRAPTNGGPWIGNRTFPDMADTAGRMKASGVRPGLWFRPLLTCESLPESLQWRLERSGRVLDPSAEGTMEFVAEQVRRFTDWGFELIKHDFSWFDCTGKWGYQVVGHKIGSITAPMHDDSRTTAELLTLLYKTISDHCGSARTIACNTPGHLTVGYAEIYRTGDDTAWGRIGDWERTRYIGINALAMRLHQNNAMHICDADCVCFSEYAPWEQTKQWLELSARSGGALFIGADPKKLAPYERRALREAFEYAAEEQPQAEPLDWQDTPTPVRWRFGDEHVRYDWHTPIGEYPSGMWWR